MEWFIGIMVAAFLLGYLNYHTDCLILGQFGPVTMYQVHCQGCHETYTVGMVPNFCLHCGKKFKSVYEKVKNEEMENVSNHVLHNGAPRGSET